MSREPYEGILVGSGDVKGIGLQLRNANVLSNYPLIER